MCHRQTTKKLNRPVNPRRALINNLLIQLYTYGSIRTTQAKAKAVKPLADRLIYKAKSNTLHVRQQLNAMLSNPKIIKKLVEQIAPQYTGKNSGFTRIVRLGQRRGDNSMMVKLELVEGNKTDKIKSKDK